ncbi:uncharacterized protein LOC100908820 [Galendromus occidentalis]|uniref:Uncharacterized protein LOC100908820 n=1 Tax=Galendromus occidentalis TaxID=34638 RepID=A0AAJ7L7M4_9ACAR|nr:uncharacterized protein LOC100908820 [Galendromus occidentalis]
MISAVFFFASLGLIAGSSYPVTYPENTTTKRPTRPWETRPWEYSTKAWNRGFSTRNRSYPTHLPTRQWDPYTNQGGHEQGQIVRFPNGQIVQYGRNTGVYGPHMTTPVIHYQQGTVPTQSWKNLPECKVEQSERCYRECEERKIHSFTCRPQFGVAFTCLCSVSIYIPNVAV